MSQMDKARRRLVDSSIVEFTTDIVRHVALFLTAAEFQKLLMVQKALSYPQERWHAIWKQYAIDEVGSDAEQWLTGVSASTSSVNLFQALCQSELRELLWFQQQAQQNFYESRQNHLHALVDCEEPWVEKDRIFSMQLCHLKASKSHPGQGFYAVILACLTPSDLPNDQDFRDLPMSPIHVKFISPEDIANFTGTVFSLKKVRHEDDETLLYLHIFIHSCELFPRFSTLSPSVQLEGCLSCLSLVLSIFRSSRDSEERENGVYFSKTPASTCFHSSSKLLKFRFVLNKLPSILPQLSGSLRGDGVSLMLYYGRSREHVQVIPILWYPNSKKLGTSPIHPEQSNFYTHLNIAIPCEVPRDDRNPSAEMQIFPPEISSAALTADITLSLPMLNQQLGSNFTPRNCRALRKFWPPGRGI